MKPTDNPMLAYTLKIAALAEKHSRKMLGMDVKRFYAVVRFDDDSLLKVKRNSEDDVTQLSFNFAVTTTGDEARPQ